MEILKLWTPNFSGVSGYITNNIPQDKLKTAIATYATNIPREKVLYLVDFTITGSAQKGYILTKDILILNYDSPKTIYFGDIKLVETLTNKKNQISGIRVTHFNHETFEDDHNMLVDWGKFALMLEEIRELYSINNLVAQQPISQAQVNEASKVNKINIQNNESSDLPTEIGGVAYGVNENINIYSNNVLFQARQGHGFAAEQANDLYDSLSGKKTSLDSDDPENHFKKNGYDRIVNGQQIQTKYCKSGSQCVNECFDETTKQFKYFDSNNQPMQIEVPSDKYDAAMESMRHKIANNQVAGVTDPNQAENIIRKGHFTYEQAVNIAKAGTIESITYDAVNGMVVSVGAMGISGAISFAVAIWNGQDIDVAAQDACFIGLKTFGVTFSTSILGSQISRTGIEKALRPASDKIVTAMGPKTQALLSKILSGKQIYGVAAKNHVSKLLRGNVVGTIITTSVLESVNVARLVDNKISKAQFTKGAVQTVATVGAGTAGYAASASTGASIGATIGSVIPVGGTIVGGAIGGAIGLIGGAVAGNLAGKGTKVIMDKLIEDDSKEMIEIFNTTYTSLAEKYILNEKELDAVSNLIEQTYRLDREFRNIYSKKEDSKRVDYAALLIEPIIKKIIKYRPIVMLPDEGQLLRPFETLLEKLEILDIDDDTMPEFA